MGRCTGWGPVWTVSGELDAAEGGNQDRVLATLREEYSGHLAYSMTQPSKCCAWPMYGGGRLEEKIWKWKLAYLPKTQKKKKTWHILLCWHAVRVWLKDGRLWLGERGSQVSVICLICHRWLSKMIRVNILFTASLVSFMQGRFNTVAMYQTGPGMFST